MDIMKKIDDLGIVTIEPTGTFSKELVMDAIKSTENIYNSLDLDSISKEISKKEEAINEILV